LNRLGESTRADSSNEGKKQRDLMLYTHASEQEVEVTACGTEKEHQVLE
jgi:hypothetical protein